MSTSTTEAALVHQAARVQPWHDFDESFLPAFLGAIPEDVLRVQVCSLFLARVLILHSHACTSSHQRSLEPQCHFVFPSDEACTDEACTPILLTISNCCSPVLLQMCRFMPESRSGTLSTVRRPSFSHSTLMYGQC